MRETFGRPSARFPLRFDRGEQVGCELREWAPSRWSAQKIVLFLKRVRLHLACMPPYESYAQAGITDAIMSVDIALSELGMVHRKSFRIIEPATNKLGFREKIVGPR